MYFTSRSQVSYYRLFNRVVDDLFMCLVHRFHDCVVDLTLTRLINRLHHSVLNFALFRVRNHASALDFFVFVIDFVTGTVTGLFALFPDSFSDVTHYGVRVAIAGRCFSRLTFGYVRITTICTASVTDGTAVSGMCGLSSDSDQHDRSSWHKPQPLHLCYSPTWLRVAMDAGEGEALCLCPLQKVVHSHSD